MWIRKLFKTLCSSLLFLFVVLLPHGICWAETPVTPATTQEEALNQLQTLLTLAFNNNQIVLQELETSKADCQELRLQLIKYQTDLLTVQEKLNQSRSELLTVKSSLTQTKNTLQQANVLLTDYEKEMKHQRSKLQKEKVQTGFWAFIAGFALGKVLPSPA